MVRCGVRFVPILLALAACSSDPVARRCSADADCDDGVYCNGTEICDVAANRCVRSAPPDCGDAFACTIDLCDEARHGCVHVPDSGACGPGESCSAATGCTPERECAADADCDDGFFCNGVETCGTDGRCSAGTAPSCDDQVACTVDFCDETLKRCAHVGDGWACSPDQRCSPTGCVAPPRCAVDADCDDHLFCNGVETCDAVAGRCVPGVKPACDDQVACTVDLCDELLGRCVAIADSSRCGPGETCGLVAGCVRTPACKADADCDDGVHCNGAETCDLAQGLCLPGTPPACGDGLACTLDLCDEAARACRHFDEPAAAGCAPLVVSRAGDGQGVVSSTPTAIDCGSACAAYFEPGTLVTLSAAPALASAFSGWSGDCAGTGACAVTMAGPRNVTANFAQLLQALTISKSGVGAGNVSSVPAGISCGVDCSESYPSSTMVFLTATPSPLSTFTGWSGGCAGVDPICAVAMDQARSVDARFGKQQFQLAVTRAGTGGGVITSTPAGISCGATCAATLDGGTLVTLTATPDGSSSFDGWSGACTGVSACLVTIDSAKSVTATFTRLSQVLSVTRTAGGTVVSSPAGIYCGVACTQPFDRGSVVTLTATTDAGGTFAGWSGACAGTSSTCTVSMDAARSVTARFTYPLVVARDGSGGGTVTTSPAGISCGATCAAAYDGGTTVSLTATPNATSTFTGWAGACSGTSSTCSVTMDGARGVTATFGVNMFNVAVTRAGAGDGAVTSSPGGVDCGASCLAAFAQNSAVTLTAVPDASSSFAGWSGACAGVGPCSLTMSGNRAVTATFAKVTYPLTIARSGAGTVVSTPAGIYCGLSCSQSFDRGSSVLLTAVPDAGGTFNGWGGACTGTSSCTVTLNSALAVSAAFTP